MSDSKSGDSTADVAAPTLDEILIALQKSLSRVSAATRSVSTEQARAMIVGKVDFEIHVRARPEGDTLRHDPAGPLDIKLEGSILQDVRARHADEDSGSHSPTNEGEGVSGEPEATELAKSGTGAGFATVAGGTVPSLASTELAGE